MILNQTHDPGHLDTTLKRELAISLHLPSGTRITPWTNLRETSNNDDLIKVNHSLQVSIEWLNLFLPFGKLWEIELDVGSRLDSDLLVEQFTVLTIDDFVLQGILLGDSLSDSAGFHDFSTEPSHHVLQVWQELQAAVQISKYRFCLAKVDYSR